jgi:tetratricopeptide (TPR) repeat protein
VDSVLILAERSLRAGEWGLARKGFAHAYEVDSNARYYARDSLVSTLSQSETPTARLGIAETRALAQRAQLHSVTAASIEAKMLHARGRDKEAALVLEQAARTPKGGNDLELLLQLGTEYTEVGLRDNAMAAFRSVATRAGKDTAVAAQAWGSLAEISFISGRPAVAVFYWDKALSLVSNYFSARPRERENYETSRKGSGLSGHPDTAIRKAPQPKSTNRPKGKTNGREQ